MTLERRKNGIPCEENILRFIRVQEEIIRKQYGPMINYRIDLHRKTFGTFISKKKIIITNKAKYVSVIIF